LFDSCVADYVLFGEVGKQVNDGLVSLEAECIEVGMKETSFNTYMRDTMRTYYKDAVIEDDKITLTVDEVPVIIHRVKRDYAFMKNPDKKFFMAETFSLPNPFNEYWKVRGLIK
jgi:hypothetical protein